MKSLKYILESRLHSRMRGYGKYDNAAYVDYFNTSNDYNTIKSIADKLVKELESYNSMCKISLGQTFYNPNDFSWFTDGLKHLDKIDGKKYRTVFIDTKYKYKNRFHPTCCVMAGYGEELHWNMKTQSWE